MVSSARGWELVISASALSSTCQRFLTFFASRAACKSAVKMSRLRATGTSTRALCLLMHAFCATRCGRVRSLLLVLLKNKTDFLFFFFSFYSGVCKGPRIPAVEALGFPACVELEQWPILTLNYLCRCSRRLWASVGPFFMHSFGRRRQSSVNALPLCGRLS